MSFTTRLRAHCLQPVTLSLTDTPRLETRLRAILAASTPRRVSLRGVLIIGAATTALSGVVSVVRPASPNDATPGPMYGRTVAPPGQWTATVNGVGVELLAVGTQDNDVSEMWRPDGTPLPGAWFKIGVKQYNPYPFTRRLVYFVVRTHKPPEAPTVGDAARDVFLTGHESNGSCNSGGSPGTAYLPGQGLLKSTPSRDVIIVYGQYANDIHKGLLQAQVADGPWEYTQEWRDPAAFPAVPKAGEENIVARKAFTSSYHVFDRDMVRHQYNTEWCFVPNREGLRLETTEPPNPSDLYNKRVRAIDQGGREYSLQPSGGASGGKTQRGFYFPIALSLSQIKAIRLQMRPYKTVEIRQVALYPNRWRGLLPPQ